MQVGKMAAVGKLREVAATNVDLDTANPQLTDAKSGEKMHLDVREMATGSSQADVVGNNSVCTSILAEGGLPLKTEDGAVVAASDDRTCVTSVAQCNHVGESDSVAKLSSSPPITSSGTVCVATNSADDVCKKDQRLSAAVTCTDVNNTDPVAVSDQHAVAVKPETSNVVAQTVPTVDGTSSSAVLSAVKDAVLLQSSAPGSPHGVTVPSIRTNAVNMVMPAAAVPPATFRTLAPRIIVSTSPATTVLRVQTVAGNVTTQPLAAVPSQQLILPVRNQGAAVPRVLCSLSGFIYYTLGVTAKPTGSTEPTGSHQTMPEPLS